VVALVSLMTGREARRNLAMTGEITLRGDILPVGGIKEKVLAARRAGVCEILIPQFNAKDLVDIPSHLREGMVIHELQLISEALPLALKGGQGGDGAPPTATERTAESGAEHIAQPEAATETSPRKARRTPRKRGPAQKA
jgi:ATP-dependent Lon protease